MEVDNIPVSTKATIAEVNTVFYKAIATPILMVMVSLVGVDTVAGIRWVHVMGILIIMKILGSGSMRRTDTTLAVMEIWTAMRTFIMGLRIMGRLPCSLGVEDTAGMAASGIVVDMDTIKGVLEDLDRSFGSLTSQFLIAISSYLRADKFLKSYITPRYIFDLHRCSFTASFRPTVALNDHFGSEVFQ